MKKDVKDVKTMTADDLFKALIEAGFDPIKAFEMNKDNRVDALIRIQELQANGKLFAFLGLKESGETQTKAQAIGLALLQSFDNDELSKVKYTDNSVKDLLASIDANTKGGTSSQLFQATRTGILLGLQASAVREIFKK